MNKKVLCALMAASIIGGTSVQTVYATTTANQIKEIKVGPSRNDGVVLESAQQSPIGAAALALLKKYWWRIGIKVIRGYSEKLFDAKGTSEYNNQWVYIVSPGIEFNTGEIGNEVYYLPKVDNTVSWFRMHAHRTIFVDVFAKMNLILSDANNRTVKSAVTSTNQYMFYDKLYSDANGHWKAQFVSNETYKWQCYYAHYFKDGTTRTYSINNNSQKPTEEDGFYFAPNNRVFQFSENSIQSSKAQVLSNTAKIQSNLSLTALNNQFINPSDGKQVDYLKDFVVGDTLNFVDNIVDIKYNTDENSTSFFFYENTSDTNIEWKFNGDLTNEYCVGDSLNLKFNVVKTGEFNGVEFESLDYFEEALNHESGQEFPNIVNYQ